MKLLTHNLLTSRFLKNVQTGYPLKLAVERVEEISTEYNEEFLQKMLKKIDYNALREAAQVCGQQLPEVLPEGGAGVQEDLKAIHKALFDIKVIKGTLECPESGRKFPISNGIKYVLRTVNKWSNQHSMMRFLSN